ncbi:MAG: hypothetical protein D6805_01715 [Planctomycetota bacterium]|nr:MAG: hypothetical protein D6805_01715 [Planctomycetota bacterium]
MEYTEFRQIDEFGDHEGRVESVCFFPDSERFLSTSEGELFLWNVYHRKKIFQYTLEDRARTLAVEPDSKRFIAGIESGGVRFWEVEEKEFRFQLGYKEGDVHFLQIHPKGQILALCEENRLELYHILTAQRQLLEVFPAEKLSAFAWAPKGHHYLTGDSEGYLTLWELESFKKAWQIYENGLAIEAVDIHFNNEYLLSHQDEVLLLRFLGNGALVGEMVGHEGKIRWARFDPLGLFAISASFGREGDYTVRIFELATQREVIMLEAEDMSCFTVSPDGKYFVAGTTEGTLLLFGPRHA